MDKRQFRELPDEVKSKISQANKGRCKSASHREHISKGMKAYWRTIPHKPQPEQTTMNDLIGAVE